MTTAQDFVICEVLSDSTANCTDHGETVDGWVSLLFRRVSTRDIGLAFVSDDNGMRVGEV